VLFLSSVVVSTTPTLVSAVGGDFAASAHLPSLALDTAAVVSLSADTLDLSTSDFAATPSWSTDVLDFADVADDVLAFKVRFLWCDELVLVFLANFADLLPTTYDTHSSDVNQTKIWR